MNQRGFAWLDQSSEHSEEDRIRAESLARRWSALHDQAEQEYFQRIFDTDEGRCPEWEPELCEACGGACFLGISRGKFDDYPDWAVGIKCPNPHCEDGYDTFPLREAERLRHLRQNDRRLELEIIERILAEVGARMMRPYEHWNEDERLMEWMERDRG